MLIALHASLVHVETAVWSQAQFFGNNQNKVPPCHPSAVCAVFGHGEILHCIYTTFKGLCYDNVHVIEGSNFSL